MRPTQRLLAPILLGLGACAGADGLPGDESNDATPDDVAPIPDATGDTADLPGPSDTSDTPDTPDDAQPTDVAADTNDADVAADTNDADTEADSADTSDAAVMPDDGSSPDVAIPDAASDIDAEDGDALPADDADGGDADAAADTPMEDATPDDVATDADDASPDTADAVCVPSCAPDWCGDDGCGEPCGPCPGRLVCEDNLCADIYAGLPHVHNLTGLPPRHAAALVSEALAGLGLDALTGPTTDDRVVITRHYIAWLDQTGFIGKMNGLWWLNGEAGVASDFVLRMPDGRPVNTFVVGEDGDGAWPAGYPGAEHLEFPNRTPEGNDNPACATRDWCNQYGLDESVDITLARIGWWVSCNAGDRAWDAIADPVELSESDGRLRIVWEERLTKQADGDGIYDGDACHTDWLFADGSRRPVYLRAGFEFTADAPWFDRVLQFRNPEGNPPFDAPMSLIGGFVLTAWPDAHPLKTFHRNVLVTRTDLDDPYRGGQLLAGLWRAWPDSAIGRDIVFGWMRQPFFLSAWPSTVTGATVGLSHEATSDNDDTGLCLCEVHGGTEVGGGLLHGGISLPIGGGARSIEARRRFQMGGDDWAPLWRRIYAASELRHGTGAPDPSGWYAATGEHGAGHMIYGPYAVDLPAARVPVLFDLAIDVHRAANDQVVTLDVYDATTDEVLATRDVFRHDFNAPMTTQTFAVHPDLTGRAGHSIETRVWWHARAWIRVERVGIYGPGAP